MLELSIIIVNWNCIDYSRDCLSSIFSTDQGLDFEVIVVDNASTKGDPDALKAEFPRIRLIKNKDNIGFAGANNVGFLESSANYLLFLNPDTLVIGNALSEMLNRLKALPDAGALGCKLLNSDGTIQTSCIQRFPTIWNQMLDFEALQYRWPQWKMWGIAPLFNESLEPVPVEVISGACLMVRRDAFIAAGQFSRDYYMYAEDVDLCYTIRSRGWKCYYAGGARVIHHGGGSSKVRTTNHWSTVMTRKAILQFCRKTRGPFYSTLYRIAVGISATGRIVLLLPLTLMPGNKSSDGDVRATISKWTAILKWSIGIGNQIAP
ncbi:MAG TPA: glycosyltransferase family 2 protein [Terriglobia bacterium]|nr:glycosyltransferase family 2 protein [Terriglobia bacterium]